MSTDRPIHREQQQDYHHDHGDTTDREQRYPGDVARLNEHELIAIDEWLPGREPTPYEIDLTNGYEYRTRYWRCRNCGQERNRREEFSNQCGTPAPPTPLEAGGYSIDEPRTRRALNEDMDVRFAMVGSLYELLAKVEIPTKSTARARPVPVRTLSSASQTMAVSIFGVSTSRSVPDWFPHQMGHSVTDSGDVVVTQDGL